MRASGWHRKRQPGGWLGSGVVRSGSRLALPVLALLVPSTLGTVASLMLATGLLILATRVIGGTIGAGLRFRPGGRGGARRPWLGLGAQGLLSCAGLFSSFPVGRYLQPALVVEGDLLPTQIAHDVTMDGLCASQTISHRKLSVAPLSCLGQVAVGLLATRLDARALNLDRLVHLVGLAPCMLKARQPRQRRPGHQHHWPYRQARCGMPTGLHVSRVSTVRRSSARNSADCISLRRETVRGNSCASGPSV